MKKLFTFIIFLFDVFLMIAIIQLCMLRLEFYEMFSRFFKGEGEPYMPVAAKEK